MLINAGQSNITLVSILTSRDAIVRGTYAGTAFTVTLHEGDCSTTGDSVWVQYVSLDTSTLTAKHGDVHTEKD